MKKSLNRNKEEFKSKDLRPHKERDKNMIEVRNMNYQILPYSITNILNNIVSLDVSHNRLGNSQIQYIFNNSPNLKYLQIQDNLSNLIPACIWKLGHLSHFRHDWVKLFGVAQEQNLHILSTVCRKPEKVVKIDSVCGINFSVYCQDVMKFSPNKRLIELIQESSCSQFAKDYMSRSVAGLTKNKKQVKVVKKESNFMMANYPGCMMLLGFNQEEDKNHKKISHKLSQNISQSLSNRSASNKQVIKINHIKNINSNKYEGESTTSDGNTTFYESEFPLHNIFVHFDSRPTASKEVQQLLKANSNPNQRDSKGLGIFHLCVIYGQIKGLRYLFDLNRLNPGFLDMLMVEEKECRNIAHYCTFLKNRPILEMLVSQNYPMDIRDKNGSRPIHLIDQNLQFLMQYKKMIKRQQKNLRNSQQTPIFSSRKLQQPTLQNTQKRNYALLSQYEHTVGFSKNIF